MQIAIIKGGRLENVAFVISQTMIVLRENEEIRVLYLLREKGDTKI
jgi:hypothetical protein